MKSEGYTHLDEELSYPVYFKENMTQLQEPSPNQYIGVW